MKSIMLSNIQVPCKQREGMRKGGKEGRREGGKEGEREGGREGRRERGGRHSEYTL